MLLYRLFNLKIWMSFWLSEWQQLPFKPEPVRILISFLRILCHYDFLKGNSINIYQSFVALVLIWYTGGAGTGWGCWAKITGSPGRYTLHSPPAVINSLTASFQDYLWPHSLSLSRALLDPIETEPSTPIQPGWNSLKTNRL